jgi:hypothetical protein
MTFSIGDFIPENCSQISMGLDYKYRAFIQDKTAYIFDKDDRIIIEKTPYYNLTDRLMKVNNLPWPSKEDLARFDETP